VRRREFLAGLGVVAWPLAARAQQTAMPVIGFLSSGSSAAWRPLVTGFLKGLQETGFNEGQNVAIEYLWADGQYDRLPELAVGLVRRQVAVIFGAGPPAAHAAKAATTTIPIVFISGDDPIKSGLVASLNRPDGNVTGTAIFNAQLGPKQLGLMLELAPKATVVAVLVNPSNPVAETFIADVRAAAVVTGHHIEVANASNADELDKAFGTLKDDLRADALIVAADPYFFARDHQVTALAARYAVPAIYEFREFAASGGLISYGASIADGYRQAGVYAGRILRGAKPADLPVLQPTKFELVINLKTAKALGITLPPGLLAIADEVIE
jgi:putative ABC transport system substrate-binding protein